MSEGLNEKLDGIILDFFSTLDDLYKTQSFFNDEMKNGFLQMSRARYNMGAKSISRSQYNENKMAASVMVNICEGDGHISIITDSVSSLKPVTEKDVTVETIGLRKRNVPQAEKDQIEDEKESENERKLEMKSDEAETKPARLCDPLNWFGVLVPQSLRQSQSSFKQAVDHAVNIANLKLKIARLQEDYVNCLSEKMKVEVKCQ